MAEKETKKSNIYVVAKREKDDKWTVKLRGGDKVIKTFDTKVEAVAYTEEMAKNQGRAMAVHKSKGANKGKIGHASSAKKIAKKKADEKESKK